MNIIVRKHDNAFRGKLITIDQGYAYVASTDGLIHTCRPGELQVVQDMDIRDEVLRQLGED